MRCGFPSLALRVQEVLKHDPLGGHLFCFRGKRGDLIKVVWHDHVEPTVMRRITRRIAWKRRASGRW
ncbi:IS66 family insertion sequence element accessory protein TnpB [Agrobacterium vitis]